MTEVRISSLQRDCDHFFHGKEVFMNSIVWKPFPLKCAPLADSLLALGGSVQGN